MDSPVKLGASLCNFQDSCRSRRGVTLAQALTLHVEVENIELCLGTEDASMVTLNSYQTWTGLGRKRQNMTKMCAKVTKFRPELNDVLVSVGSK